MKKEIAGVLVLYYPDEKELRRNIGSYLPYVDRLFVIDNTDHFSGTGISKMIGELTGVSYIANDINKGVAAALNSGASMALENGYSWLLTMDQDSFFESGQAATFFSNVEELARDSAIAIVAPSHFRKNETAGTGPWSEQAAVMTSGNLIRTVAWKKVNGFDEKLFIDEVDHEYCYRIKNNGYRIVQLNHVFLEHQLGTQKMAGYLGLFAKKLRRVHSPKRVYFMVRNYLFVRRQYRKFFPAEFRTRDKELMVMLKNNLFFSGHLFLNLKSIRKAYRDFKKGEFSNQP